MVSVDRLKLNEHDALPQERRKVWQEVSRLIDTFLSAKSRYKPGVNDRPLGDMENASRQLRTKLNSAAELSSVATWCVLFRNDRQLLRLIG
jgi:hypothetical protein